MSRYVVIEFVVARSHVHIQHKYGYDDREKIVLRDDHIIEIHWASGILKSHRQFSEVGGYRRRWCKGMIEFLGSINDWSFVAYLLHNYLGPPLGCDDLDHDHLPVVFWHHYLLRAIVFRMMARQQFIFPVEANPWLSSGDIIPDKPQIRRRTKKSETDRIYSILDKVLP